MNQINYIFKQMNQWTKNPNYKQQFEQFATILKQENQKYNLVSRKSISDLYYRHFFDSALILKFYQFSSGDHILDVGSGAGFPGLVLKILNPDLHITFVESSFKKCEFIKKIINQLQLQKLTVINSRVEHLNKSDFNFNFIMSRAVASVEKIFSFLDHLININQTIILYKGPKYQEEIKMAHAILNQNNIINFHNDIYYDDFLGTRTFCFFKKKTL